MSTADSIVIGAGTQQLLSVLCGLLPRDSVIAIEEPGFRQAEQVFQDYGFPLRLVGGDQEGISMRELVRKDPTTKDPSIKDPKPACCSSAPPIG